MIDIFVVDLGNNFSYYENEVEYSIQICVINFIEKYSWEYK